MPFKKHIMYNIQFNINYLPTYYWVIITTHNYYKLTKN